MSAQGVLWPETPVRWHLGTYYGGRWHNAWIAHPCHDLALPFELGVRAFH